MRGNAKVFTLASVALLSCRAVLGIEEIEEGTVDGGAGTGDAAAESVGSDSSNVIETSVPETGCASAADCNVCCREPLEGTAALPELETIAKQTGCVCGDAGVCASECVAICSGTGMPGPTCMECLVTAVSAGSPPACAKALNECIANTTCKPVGECLNGCKQR